MQSNVQLKDVTDLKQRFGKNFGDTFNSNLIPIPVEQLDADEAREATWGDVLDRAIVSSSELADLSLPPRASLLGDWFREGDLGIIYAFRGVGKTWLAMLIAKALSEGSKLGAWQANGRTKVLYVDGEMPAELIKDRDNGLTNDGGEIEFLNHEILFERTGKVLNITNHDVQSAIMERCIRDGVKVVILDNLSTLASGMKENDASEWEQVHNWLLQFRRHRVAVVLVHHAGRNGEARGTSKREDATFWVIALDDAKKDSDDKRGARFISRFTKTSRNTQEEIPAYEWHITTDPISHRIDVACKAAQSIDVFRKLVEDGVTDCTQIAEEMKVSKATVSKMSAKAIREGWLRKNGREYAMTEGNEAA